MTRYRHLILDGLDIFYREAGNPNKPTLLLLHGFPASSFMFGRLMESLADDFHLIAPDYPGFGYSAAPEPGKQEVTFDFLADVILSFTDQLGLSEYWLYMQDFGGPVGFRLAARHPERVLGLIIQNANAYEEGLPDSFWAPAKQLWDHPSAENTEQIRNLATSDDALSWNYTHGTRDPQSINPDNWVLQQALLAKPGIRDIMVGLLKDYGSNPPLYGQWQAYFREFKPRTLITWGKNDVVFPPEGAYPYLRDIPDAELHLLDTGHFALEEDLDVIANHIRRVAAAGV